MTSGAQRCPRLPGTALVRHDGMLVNTRGPLVQLTRSFECHDTIPLPVAKVQYSSLHFTIVDGSCTGTFRLPARASASAASDGALVSCAREEFKEAMRMRTIAPKRIACPDATLFFLSPRLIGERVEMRGFVRQRNPIRLLLVFRSKHLLAPALSSIPWRRGSS